MSEQPAPFKLIVPTADIADLRERLRSFMSNQKPPEQACCWRRARTGYRVRRSLIRRLLRALFICIVSYFRIRCPESLLAQSI
jgi:hypothetical protein